MKTQTLIVMLAAFVVSTGCTTFKPQLPTLSMLSSNRDARTETVNDVETDEGDFGTPVKMVAIWKDSVRSEPGQPSMRGFGGRIFLYDDEGTPVRAKGDLVIYGFDDSVKDREGSKADQKIVIRNDRLQKRYSKSGLGDSYSVWVDWDRVGGVDKSVTLVPFFRMPDGKIVKGGQAIYTLHSPGQEKLHKEKLVSHETDASGDQESGVEHADFQQADGEGNGVVTASGVENISKASRKKSVRTTTIRMPAGTQRRIREASAANASNDNSAEADDAAVETIRSRIMHRREDRPSRIEAARKKRRDAIGEGNVFGMPGQL